MFNKSIFIFGFCIIFFISFCYADSEFYIYEIADNQIISAPILDRQFNNIFISVNNLSCVPNWVCTSYTCGINDIASCTIATDLNVCNMSYVGDYSEFETNCNYCNENIYQTDSACYDNGAYQVFNRTYIDYNYATCCAITNLSSDCDILNPPYNSVDIRLCADQFNTTNTINCSTETFAGYGFGDDKVNWLCNVIQPEGTNVTCISYVKDIDSGIVQTNPTYSEKSQGFITQSVEDRTSFLAEKGLVQVYFDKENLVFDGRDYVYGVKCSDGNTITKFEKVSQPEYKKVNAPITRLFWLQNNVGGILLGLLGVIVLVVLISLGIRILRK